MTTNANNKKKTPTKRAVGRPAMGKVKVTVTMTKASKDQAIKLAKTRGMPLGTLFSELVRDEVGG